MKRKSILLVGTLLPFAVMAQQPFSLKGEVKGLLPGVKVFLSYNADGKSILDSATAQKGVFAFNGKIKDPVRSTLFKKSGVKGTKNDALSFYLEPANITITSTDSLKKATVTGSLINNDNDKLKTISKPVQDQLALLSAEYYKFTPEQKNDKAFLDSFYKRHDSISEGLTPIYLDFARKNTDSYISLVVLSQLATDEKVQSEAEQLYNGLSPQGS
ncbi:DUF4369 domain-containing protein [Pedobacter sp. NJ-S-72]